MINNQPTECRILSEVLGEQHPDPERIQDFQYMLNIGIVQSGSNNLQAFTTYVGRPEFKNNLPLLLTVVINTANRIGMQISAVFADCLPDMPLYCE